MSTIYRARRFGARVLRRLGSMIHPGTEDIFLAEQHWQNCGFRSVDLAATVVARAAATGKDISFVQIGAHDGVSDATMRECVALTNMHGVFVEPQTLPFADLTRTYAGNPRIACERAVIGTSDGTARLYTVDPAFWAEHELPTDIDSQISSLHRQHIVTHVARFGGNALAAREDDYLRWVDVPSLTLPTLLAKHGLGDALDLLVIDTEGFDFEVLKMVDWDQPPAIICYESIWLKPDDRHESWQMLSDHGYALSALDEINTLAVRLPDKRG